MFRGLGHFIYRRRVAVALFGALFLMASAVGGAGLFSRLSSGGYDNPDSDSARVARRLEADFGGGEGALVVLLTAPEGQSVDTPAFSAGAQAQLARLRAFPGILNVNDAFNTGAAQLIAPDRKSSYAVAQLSSLADHREVIHALRLKFAGSPVLMQFGGAPAIDADVLDQVGRDLKVAEAITLPVTAVLLLFVFGSVLAAALPLAMAGLSILGAFLLLRLLVLFTPVSVFSVNVVSMLGMGLAIDYSLFIVSRFREELGLGKTVEAALVRTLQTAGHTVLFSGMTVTLSLLSLLLFPQMLLRSMGLGGSIGVLVAMGGSLTVLPALLALLGHRVNALAVRLRRAPASEQATEERGFWFRLSHLVMKRPVTVLCATLIPLLVAGSPFLHVRFSMPDERNIPRGLESRVVAERLKAQFTEGALSPVELLLHFKDGPVARNDALDTLYDYVRTLQKLPGVVRVVSLANLDPRLDSKSELHRFLRMVRSGNLPEGQAALDHFAQGSDTLVQLFFKGDPRGSSARALVESVRAMPPPVNTEFKVGGVSAQLLDLLADMGRVVPRALLVIIVTVFCLLFLMLGSLVVPFKAVLLNLLSLTVTFGGLVFVFQDGHFGRILGTERLGSIDALQPVLVFVIAFGLSMDYEVFLLSRIKESFDQTQDNARSVALGVQRTGGLITSAAALLCVVILGFATGRVLSLKQVGFGLLLAVLVDATLVRSLLVPATMRLLGSANWWAPAPLKRLYEKLGWGKTVSADEA